VNTLKPEPKKSTLGQFRPETRVRGRWLGYTALACAIGSFVLNELWGVIPGAILAAAAIYVGKIGLDSKARIPALIALLVGILLIGLYLTVLFVGKENIGVTPA